MHKKKRNFFIKLLAVIILGIFSLAIIPWGALHHHEETVTVVEKNCTHKVHVKNTTEHCLICKAHFEKNYTSNTYNYVVYLKIASFESIYPLVGNSFTKLIATSLRGPPNFS